MDTILDAVLGALVDLFIASPLEAGLFIIIILVLVYLMFGSKITGRAHTVYVEYHIVKEQMKKAEERADCIEDSILKLYLKMRKEARGKKSGLMKDNDVQHFQLLLKYLKKKSLKYIRHSFRENHLAERENYESWTDMKAEEIMREMRELLNAWFPSDDEPELEQFYDRYLVEKRGEVKEGIKACFREAKDISLQFKDKKFLKGYFKTYGG